MDLERRRQMLKMLENIERFPDLSKRIGLVDSSTYHGERVADHKEIPPLST